MIDPTWSWVLTIIFFVSATLIARRRVIGLYVATVGQAVTFVYGALTHQWGFLLGAVLFSGINVYGIVHWRRSPCNCATAEVDR